VVIEATINTPRLLIMWADPRFLRNLREQRETALRFASRAEGRSEGSLERFPSFLSAEGNLTISNRAASCVEKLDAATGMQHLKTGDRNTLRRSKDGEMEPERRERSKVNVPFRNI
jgi:hypothetical protein